MSSHKLYLVEFFFFSMFESLGVYRIIKVRLSYSELEEILRSNYLLFEFVSIDDTLEQLGTRSDYESLKI